MESFITKRVSSNCIAGLGHNIVTCPAMEGEIWTRHIYSLQVEEATKLVVIIIVCSHYVAFSLVIQHKLLPPPPPPSTDTEPFRGSVGGGRVEN